MGVAVSISLGNGSLEEGFPSVTAQITEIGNSRPQKAKMTGSLPPASNLVKLYKQWSEYYKAFNRNTYGLRRLEVDNEDVSVHFSPEELYALSQRLTLEFNTWLSANSFRDIDQQLRTKLDAKQEFQVIIESSDREVWQLPWHLWRFFKDFPLAEPGISSLEYSQVLPSTVARKVSRVLAILGNSTGINIEKDKQVLQDLLGTEIIFLVEPTREEFNNALWDSLGWDVLFFAGHSNSQNNNTEGYIKINLQEELSLSELIHGLKQIIAKGLTLAIFNSCQGLGMASDLAELSIPHLIVMREPVPDLVAQTFLKVFLETFVNGGSFTRSFRESRLRLQGLEKEFPYASWLPVTYQNPCEIPPVWSQLSRSARTQITLTPSSAKLKMIAEDQSISYFELGEEPVFIGRSEECIIHLTHPSVSRRHASITKDRQGFKVIDLESRYGTKINGNPLIPKQEYILNHGDRLEVSRFLFEFLREGSEQGGRETVQKTVEYNFSLNERSETLQISFRNRSKLTIGRHPTNDLQINHPGVSSFHALLDRQDQSIYITDLKSTNGTFVNFKRVKGRKVLGFGDRLRIGSYTLILNDDESFTSVNEVGNLRLDAVNLSKTIFDVNLKKERRLLNEIYLSILPREFVVIAGVSGGGKSTLIDALSGFRPATSGNVYVNNVDLYRNYDAYRSEIGYVPQQDIVHIELTVLQALKFAAKLRMPPDTTFKERSDRIEKVLTELKLNDRKHTEISRLSGGQKKRVSIALELLTQPGLFFLDEATSGLDPATEAEVMQILRDIANRGRTVLLITHATESINISNIVLFLAKEGHIAYFGPSKNIQTYFQNISGQAVESFSDIYRLVELDPHDEKNGKENRKKGAKTPQEWQRAFSKSQYYQNYVTDRQQHINSEVENQRGLIRKAPSTSKNIPFLRQFLILTERNFTLLFRDRTSMLLVLLVMPILGVLDLLTWDRNLFAVDVGNAGQAITMLFNTTLVAIIAGSLSTMREIVKESDIYRRERANGVRVTPYILSKFAFCIALSIYQATILLLFKYLSIDLPGDAISYFFILLLCTISGTVLGLLVSTIAPNQNVAPLLTIIFLIPQITFGGGLLPAHTLSLPGRAINYLTLTKWPFEALITVSQLGKNVAEDPCWQKSKTQRQNLSDTRKSQDCKCLGKNVFEKCNFPGIRSEYDANTKKYVESPEPVQPKKPSSPGLPSLNPAGQLEYQEKVNQFNEEIKNWEIKMESWRDNFSRWKEKRESAIGGAESTLGKFKEDYGQGFKVNMFKHMLAGVGQIFIMLLSVIYLQKRKDTL